MSSGGPKQFAQVGDIVIRYDLADYTDPWRSDPPETFLLYSGYCRTSEFWRAWVPLLGRDYRVLRMDPRGYGDTTKPPPGSTIAPDLLVSDVIGLMDVLAIERVHWVGEVTGGTLGLLAALAHPQRIASVTLCNAYAKMGDQTKTNYALGEASQEAAITKYGVAEWCRRTLQYRLDVKQAPPGLGEWMASEMAKTPVHIAVAAFKIFSNVDLNPRLGEIRVPVMIVVGSKCSERLKGHLTEMCERLPRAKLVQVDGYNYGIHFLAPDEVVPEVRRFVCGFKA
ncbi:MAG: alpha/beta hydrolase [Betaproteobacteria bacterium]|nr:alpha/beta hydrolase [Betaproteobacteria bacterium]MDH3436343.1 alpha/beta hydrolase [Betaproteobacteria bacterium]